MNTAILKKVIDALKEKEPKIDYVLGMLETLYEMQVESEPDRPIEPGHVAWINKTVKEPVFNEVKSSTDEASILDAAARASLQTIKAMSEKGQNA